MTDDDQPLNENGLEEPTTNEPGSLTLAEALATAQIELPDEQVELLERYARLLWSWNEKLNLTRHTTWDKFVMRDLVDSQWLERYLDAGERVLDLGTGGGVPGIILAILRPDLEVTLCDSVAKKARAVGEIVRELDLPIQVLHNPVQAVLHEHEFETIVCRAVAPLTKLFFWLAPCWEQFQQLLVIKGPAWNNELAEARVKKTTRGIRVEKLASYPMPGTESESVILQVRQG